MLLASETPRGSHEPNLSLWWCSILQTRSFNSLFNTKYTVKYTSLCIVTQTSKWILTHVNKWIPTHECHNMTMHTGRRVCCVYAGTLELLLSYVGELRKINPAVYLINIGIRQSPWGITMIWLNKTLIIWRTLMLFHEQNFSTKKSRFLARICRCRQG